MIKVSSRLLVGTKVPRYCYRVLTSVLPRQVFHSQPSTLEGSSLAGATTCSSGQLLPAISCQPWNLTLEHADRALKSQQRASTAESSGQLRKSVRVPGFRTFPKFSPPLPPVALTSSSNLTTTKRQYRKSRQTFAALSSSHLSHTLFYNQRLHYSSVHYLSD